MPIVLAALTVLVQIIFIVHVFRTGRPYWWAFLILGTPILGSLIYYFVEIFPGSQEHRRVRRTVSEVAKSLNPDAELKRRAEELEVCGSVDNKLALAEECMAVGMFDEAVKLYDSALAGPYAQDNTIRFRLAHALLRQDSCPRALATLRAIRAGAPGFRAPEIDLMEARCLHAMGDSSAALAIYERIVPGFVGLEAKTRQALLLKDLGHTKQAQGLFEEIVAHGRRFGIRHRGEEEWLEIAGRERRA